MKVTIDIFDKSNLTQARHKIDNRMCDGYYLPCDNERSFVQQTNYAYFYNKYHHLECMFSFGSKLFLANDIPEESDVLIELFSDIQRVEYSDVVLDEDYYLSLLNDAQNEFLHDNVQEFIAALELPPAVEETLFGLEGIFSFQDCIREMEKIIREHNFSWDFGEQSVWLNIDAIAQNSRWRQFSEFLSINSLNTLSDKVFSAVVKTDYQNDLLVAIHADIEKLQNGEEVQEAFYANN